jgi:hypothetical protein
MIRRLTLAFIALLPISNAFAQPLLSGKWWRRPEIVQSVSITDEQQDRLESIFRASANELIDLRGDVQKLTVALRGELDRTQLDASAIHRLAARLSETRGRLFDRELSMLIDMRKVLSDAQWIRVRNELNKLPPPGGRGREPVN